MSALHEIDALLEGKKQEILQASDTIWEYAELSREETKSSELLISILEKAGFTVERNICGVETAFIASYGSGKPVMALLGEYDALANLSQVAGATEKCACPGQEHGSGHGCGHNLLGTACLAAALAVKDYLQQHHLPGTIRYYGCAAEEEGGVKPWMARDGYFDDCDCAFTWHPSDTTGVFNLRHYADKVFYVEFFGKSAHAAASPEMGRSALDACELMNIGCNYLREHVVPNSRIHYAYVDAGGTAYNIVQSHCVMKYGVRSMYIKDAEEITERVKDVARGAALMTGTRVEFKPLMGYSDCFQNAACAQILNEAMEEAGGPQWDDADYASAAAYLKTYDPSMLDKLSDVVKGRYPKDQWQEKKAYPLDTQITAFDPTRLQAVSAGSTDVGDVGYVTPTAQFVMATRTLATPAHSWYQTSAGGSTIGHKAVMAAARVLALACVKALEQPAQLEKARAEWLETTGGEYHCPM